MLSEETAPQEGALRESAGPAQGRRWPGAHVFRIDMRSLALLRIAYGFLLFCDTVVRWTDIRAHYSDFGVLPRQELLELAWNENWFSLHMASGSLIWLHGLFLLQTVCSIALLIGWRTRLVTVLSWLLLISVHSRNPAVLNGGDIYMRCILFWMLFLPWGHRWSYDSKWGRGDHLPWMNRISGNSLKGVAALAVVIQIACVYWFAALPKTDPSWMVDYSATQLALRVDQFVTPAGYLFRDLFDGQLAILTWAVILWEALGPFLFFFPFDQGQTRTVGILGFMALHLGFGTMMQLGFFAWIGFLTPLVLLPAWVWDVPLKTLSCWADARFGDGGERESGKWYSVPRELFFTFFLVYSFVWNLGNEELQPRQLRVPRQMAWIGHSLRLDQRWNMFSPGPFTEDGWFIIEGHFKDGRVLDLFKNGGEISWDKPRNVAGTYKNQRWRKYMMNLWLIENERYRLPFGQYICRLWNKNGRSPRELSTFSLIYMLETTNLDGSETEPEKRVIWQHWCFEKPSGVEKKAPALLDGGMRQVKPGLQKALRRQGRQEPESRGDRAEDSGKPGQDL